MKGCGIVFIEWNLAKFGRKFFTERGATGERGDGSIAGFSKTLRRDALLDVNHRRFGVVAARANFASMWPAGASPAAAPKRGRAGRGQVRSRTPAGRSCAGATPARSEIQSVGSSRGPNWAASNSFRPLSRDGLPVDLRRDAGKGVEGGKHPVGEVDERPVLRVVVAEAGGARAQRRAESAREHDMMGERQCDRARFGGIGRRAPAAAGFDKTPGDQQIAVGGVVGIERMRIVVRTPSPGGEMVVADLEIAARSSARSCRTPRGRR